MAAASSELPGYTFVRKVGTGTFSDVYYGIHIATKAEVAVKVTRKGFDESLSIQNMRREAEILMSLHHPFIASFYEFRETDMHCYLVMEYVNGVSLLDYINEKKGLSDTDAKPIFQQLVSAISYIHSKNVIHRDLKAENIMYNPDTKRVKIIDFGFSNSSSTVFQTMCGSLAYCAPEILKRQQYTLSADIWSLGVVLYSMLRCRLPFHSDNQPAMMQTIINGEPKYDNMSVIACDLTKHMLTKDPNERITMQEIQNHPFVRDDEYTILELKVATHIASCEKVNSHIVDLMKSNGWGNSDLERDLREGADNDQTVTYRILRRTRGPRRARTHFRHTLGISSSKTCDSRLPLRIATPEEARPDQPISRENCAGVENQLHIPKPMFSNTARNSGRLELKSLMTSMLKESARNGWRGHMPQIRQRTLTFE